MLGDVNTSADQDGARARPSMVQHCTNLPRPYSRIHMVQGTKGCLKAIPIASTSKGAARTTSGWRPDEMLRRSSSIRCGRRSRHRRPGAGHGGMDFIEDYRLIKCLRDGTADRHECVRRGRAQRRSCELSCESVADAVGPWTCPTSRAGSGRRPATRDRRILTDSPMECGDRPHSRLFLRPVPLPSGWL